MIIKWIGDANPKFSNQKEIAGICADIPLGAKEFCKGLNVPDIIRC